MFQQQYGIVNYYEAPLPIGRPDLLGLFVFKILGTSRIRIQIVGVEGKDADH